MAEHETVDVVLPSFCPLAVVLPNNCRGISQDVSYLVKGGALLEESCCQGVAIPVGMSVLYARLLENRR